jgi:hypothetical protein
MALVDPAEPMELKNRIIRIKAALSSGSRIDWESATVWIGNSLPKHLWENWKRELSKNGFTWQKFLKFMKYHTEDVILWSNEEISWKDFVEKVCGSLEGPLGEMIRGRQGEE